MGCTTSQVGCVVANIEASECAGKAYVRDMKEVNKVLEFALEGADTGIHFTSSGLTWHNMVVCTSTDASFCNDTIVVNEEKEGNCSQQGYLAVLALADMMKVFENH